MKRALARIAALIAAVLFLTETSPALAALRLPPSLKRIAEEAFMGDRTLRGLIEIPGNVTEIGADAFTDSGAYAFEMGSGVRNVGRQALPSAAYVLLRGSDTALAADAFSGVSAFLGNAGSTAQKQAASLGADFYDLSSLALEDGWYYQNADGGVKLLFARDAWESGWFVHIPESVNGKTVTAISPYAFQGCTSLRTVELPGRVRPSVRESAFASCPDAEIVYYGDTEPVALKKLDLSQDGSGTVTAAVTLRDGEKMTSADSVLIFERLADGGTRQVARTDSLTASFAVLTEGTHTYFARSGARQWGGGTRYSADSADAVINIRVLWTVWPEAPRLKQTGADQVTVSWSPLYPADQVCLWSMPKEGGEWTLQGTFNAENETTVTAALAARNLFAVSMAAGSGSERCESRLSAPASLDVAAAGVFAPAAPELIFEDRPFASAESGAPEYGADEEIQVSWESVPGALSYAYTLERKTGGAWTAVTAESDVAVNGIRLLPALFSGAAEPAVYRFGIRSVGKAAGDIAYSFFAVNPADTAILVDGAESARWDRAFLMAGERTFSVKSGPEWWVESHPSWITVETGENCLTLRMKDNTAWLQELSGEVILSNGADSAVITVNHDDAIAAPDVTRNGVLLSADENDPTPIPAGTFRLGIEDNKANHVFL